jgi:hypothetical protein
VQGIQGERGNIKRRVIRNFDSYAQKERMMHDFREQRADTFQTFATVSRGVKLPKESVVVYEFVAEEVDTKWAAVEKELRAKGFKASHTGDVLQARIGPITIEAETVWHWERIATEIVLPYEFYPDGWELADDKA